MCISCVHHFCRILRSGVMGNAMCGHLLAHSKTAAAPLFSRINVFNRTVAKTDALVAAGAYLMDSPAKVAQQSGLKNDMNLFLSCLIRL